MATRDIVVLNETAARLENPQPGDTANVPAPLQVQGELKPVSGVRFPDGTIATTARAIGSTDYVPLADKGAANGVATLDANQKLVQMPTAADVGAAPSSHTTDYANPHQVTAAQTGAIPTTDRGAANGVASLDANNEVVEMPAGAAAQVAAGNGGYVKRADGTWGTAGGASGGSGNQVFYENDIHVTANYTITTNKNAMSAGPIIIDAGVTVTVPSGSVWTIVGG